MALPQPDPDILRLARRGDERAFAVIVRQYQSPLFNYIARVLSGPLICLMLAPFLANTFAVSTWPGVVLKGLVLWGLLSVTLISLLPTARTEATSAFMAVWSNAQRMQRQYA